MLLHEVLPQIGETTDKNNAGWLYTEEPLLTLMI